MMNSSTQTNTQIRKQTSTVGTGIPQARRRQRSMHLHDARTIAAPRDQVFRFITDCLPAQYTKLAVGHHQFVVEGGGPVRPGSVIDCRERASNQEVHHRYVVQTYEPSRHLYYASLPSKTFIHLPGRVIEDESDTHVYFDLTDTSEGTRVEMTIVIQLKSRTQHWLAVATGSTGLWKRHLAEELTKLKELIEA